MAKLLFLFIIFCGTVALSRAECNEVLNKEVSPKDIETILNTHNTIRSDVSKGNVPDQPKPINELKPLKWDDKLAEEAQKIADTCEVKHVRVLDDRFEVGQNLGWTQFSQQSSEANWDNIIQDWFSEHADYVFPGSGAGHYTQIVSENTEYIGCGWTHYKLASELYSKLYVCNYGPAGNYVNVPPYKA